MKNNKRLIAKLLLIVVFSLATVSLANEIGIDKTARACHICCEKDGAACAAGCAWWNLLCRWSCADSIQSCLDSCFARGFPEVMCDNQ